MLPLFAIAIELSGGAPPLNILAWKLFASKKLLELIFEFSITLPLLLSSINFEAVLLKIKILFYH